jgi:serine/threonine protein kinase
MSIRPGSHLEAGQALGHYQLIRVLDQRSMIEVWQGQHISLHTPVALKVLRWDSLQEDESTRHERRLYHEAQVLATLHHQHIVGFRDYLVWRNFRALVIQYAPGGSVARYHANSRRLPLSLIRQYTWQVSLALSLLHRRGMIHRDVKPGNILLLGPRYTLLADFGLAMYEPAFDPHQRAYRGGTASYMAPEQYRGHPCPASDQYGLAICVYEWLTGYRPFSGDIERMMRKRERSLPRPVRTFRPEVPAAVDEILRIALHPDPEKRYPTVMDFAHDFVNVTRTRRPPLVRRLPYYRNVPFRDGAGASRAGEQSLTRAQFRDTGERQAVHPPALLPTNVHTACVMS